MVRNWRYHTHEFALLNERFMYSQPCPSHALSFIDLLIQWYWIVLCESRQYCEWSKINVHKIEVDAHKRLFDCNKIATCWPIGTRWGHQILMMGYGLPIITCGIQGLRNNWIISSGLCTLLQLMIWATNYYDYTYVFKHKSAKLEKNIIHVDIMWR